MTTLRDALAETERRFAQAGIESARADSRILLQHATGLDRMALLTRSDAPVEPRAAKRLACVTRRRTRREPVALITGSREFWSLPFKVTRATLVPRPDSETLIEAALEVVADRSRALRVLDLGTGSGCLLLALLSELPNATGIGIDASPAALTVAARNARALGLGERAQFVAGDWGAPLTGAFDIILANPPYVSEAEWQALDDDVKVFEPKSALSAGVDGLEAYRALAPAVARLLAPGGAFLGEIGAGQETAAARILDNARLAVRSVRCDLSGIPRCLLATFGGNAAFSQLRV